MPVDHCDQVKAALGHGNVGEVGAPYLVGCRGQALAQRLGVRHDNLPGNRQARFGIDWLMAHQPHEPAHALFVDDVTGQLQVVAQAEHALEIVVRKLLVEQSHEIEVVRAFPAGLVVKTAAGQPQGLAAGLYKALPAGLHQCALLSYTHGLNLF